MSKLTELAPLSAAPDLEATARLRAEVLMRQHERRTTTRVDHLFGGLLLAEWAATVLIASLVSPRLWTGTTSRVHLHVWAALLVGGAIAVPAAVLALRRAGEELTRHAVAVAQMLLGVLLIHVTGGRIETHFYIFGSLAFIAFYRDWRVIVTSTLVVVIDHVVRGLYWPQSVYGVAYASILRALEHGGWVVFEDAFLIISCLRARKEMRGIAERHAQLEAKADAEMACRAAEEANRVKSEFLANMSHEIRTPLTAIQGFAELLLEEGLPQSERTAHAQIIRRNSEHLLAIINDILDLSKIEAGKMHVESVSCSPAQIVADVASLMRVRASAKKLAFEVAFLTPIPVSVQSDPTRIRQVLMNLVGNAIKFTHKGSVRVLVRCDEADSLGPTLSFAVVDTGIGLTADQTQRLFKPFSQADSSTTRKYGGTGLGLAICQRMSKILGGELSVESTGGVGSSFTARVRVAPLNGVAMVHNLKEAGVPEQEVAAPTLGRLSLRCSVLLAEDGPDNQTLISALLRKAGASVVVAEDGEKAVELALRSKAGGKPFDVILMDMQMPRLDGYGATTQLRAKGWRGAIVALTAHAMSGCREQCIAAGCDDYLAKPVDRMQLLRTVKMRGEPETEADSSTLVDPAAPPERPKEAPPASDTRLSGAPLYSAFAGDPDLADILPQFIDGLPETARKLDSAAARNDAATLSRLVHQLKGAAGGYGFPTITAQAKVVEDAIRLGIPQAELTLAVQELLRLCSSARTGSPATALAS